MPTFDVAENLLNSDSKSETVSHSERFNPSPKGSPDWMMMPVPTAFGMVVMNGRRVLKGCDCNGFVSL